MKTNPEYMQMMDFRLDTYESTGSFPEVTINARVIIPALSGISSVDTATLKSAILSAVYETTTLSSR